MVENSLQPIPEYCDLMTIAQFVESVKTGLFIDYDGHGYYANSKYMSTVLVTPSDIRRCGPLQGWTHVAWFNR